MFDGCERLVGCNCVAFVKNNDRSEKKLQTQSIDLTKVVECTFTAVGFSHLFGRRQIGWVDESKGSYFVTETKGRVVADDEGEQIVTPFQPREKRHAGRFTNATMAHQERHNKTNPSNDS